MEALKVAVNHAGYFEKKRTINNIHFSIREGELVGLIGPNGAGKSTIIKSILGLVEEIDGNVSFINKKKYAYIPEQPTYYEELTLWEHIELAKSVHQLGDKVAEERVNELLETFRLTEAKHEFPTSFSKGMQQKLMIVIAILLKPQVYIVDEPFIGLDPKAIKDFLSILKEEQQRGAAILMSTHVLDTAEKICDRFLLINNGSFIATGTLNEIREVSMNNASLMDCFYFLMEQST